MKHARFIFITSLCACGPVVATSDDAGDTGASLDTTIGETSATTSFPGTTSPGTSVGTTPEPTTFPTTVDPETTTEVGEDDCGKTCCGFLCPPDGGGSAECDVWAQDCPRGEKCMPWGNDGGNAWNATRCSPLDPSPGQVGDACTAEVPGLSGIDTCDIGLVCLYFAPDSGVGTCVENCSGNEQSPQCEEPDTLCEIAFEGVIHSCLHACDPLLQDCPEGAACYPGDLGFVCGDTVDPALAIGEPCDYEWDCVAGSFCAAADTLPACDGEACCTAYCDS
ncbi:MAG TPA: hypothetical protein VG755_29335, partial [Nannocystaceae bacterium]|nr:hypothetical protein [Nannocystaceae bacterium]